MTTAFCFWTFNETAEHCSLNPNMFFSLTKLTKQESCESYLCGVVSTNELQPLGLEKLLKISKSVHDRDSISQWQLHPNSSFGKSWPVVLSELAAASLPTI